MFQHGTLFKTKMHFSIMYFTEKISGKRATVENLEIVLVILHLFSVVQPGFDIIVELNNKNSECFFSNVGYIFHVFYCSHMSFH